MGRYTDKYDHDLKRAHELYLSETTFPWQMLKAQAIAESNLDPNAVSSVGAKGLMQLMPGTFGDMVLARVNPVQLSKDTIFHPRVNIEAGAAYMAWLYKRYEEIPDPIERYKFVLAAYNAGRGNINKALCLARDDEGLQPGFKAWAKSGRIPGDWQRWGNTKDYLKQVTGHHSTETLNYIARIFGFFNQLIFQSSSPSGCEGGDH